MKRALISMMMVLLVVALFAVSLDALSNPSPSWTNSPKTNDTLNCSWTNSSDATTTNVTILRDSSIYGSWNTTNTSILVPSSATSKGETWTCNVTVFNGTANTTSYTTVEIDNSPPDTTTNPNGIYDEVYTEIGYYYVMLEDTTYILDFNASDPDGDTLNYGLTEHFCNRTSSTFGTYACNAGQEYLDGSNSKITNITFTVSDGQDVSGRVVSFNVTPVNDAPTATVTDQITPVNQTLNYDIDATDEESNTPFVFSLINTPAEISDILSIASVDGDTGRITYDASTPHYEDINVSAWQIIVRINDSDGAYNDYSFLLNITAVGRVPSIINYTSSSPAVGGVYTIAEDSGMFQINITANDSDSNDVHTFIFTPSITNMDTATTQTYVNVSNTSGQINFSPTDANVGLFSINVTVRDKELLIDSVTFTFNVTNTQDAPVIYNESYDASNTNSNTNLSNVTSFATAPLVFAVNATDDDLDSGDTLTFSDNTSLFNINPSTGVISFTPDSADASATPYSINISVTDGMDTAWTIMNLWILNNTPPYFSPYPLPSKVCPESASCTYNLSNFSQEPDAGDSIETYTVTFVGSSIANFSYNQSSGIIDFTPAQTDISEYTLNVTITDERGASNSTTFTMNITNTPEAPVLTIYDFSSQTIVENHAFSFTLQATDNDLFISNTTENLTFADNLSFTTITYDRTSGGTVYALIAMTPLGSEVGNHTIRINVTDVDGLYDEEVFTFEIFNDTLSPRVDEVKPYGNSSNSYALVDEMINTSDFGANSTRVVFSENTSYQFAHVTWDENIPALSTTWYYDDVQVSTDWNYTRNFTFYSSGSHQVKLFVEDNRLENATFLWNLTINDVNRKPQLLNSLSAIPPINTTYVFGDYLGRYNDTTYFYDPDDDPNGDFIWNGSETNRLTFSVTQCLSGGTELASIALTGASISITPIVIGSCQIIFTAIDSGSLSLQSNTITLNISAVPEGSNETTVEEQPSGGGGSTTRSSYIPITRETEIPEPIHIIAPKIVTMYDNNSMIIPFDIKNTWSEDLFGISLAVYTNATEVMTNLSINLIEELGINQTIEVNLLVSNYRLGENYEIEISANVTDPEFEDTALIILTSIEQASEGDQVEVKVTFARDLFNEHPECQELNELLNKANEELAANNFLEARRYVDTAINGCKYIVSSLNQRTERPDQLSSIFTIDEMTFQTIIYLALAFLVFVTLAFIVYYHFTNKESDDI